MRQLKDYNKDILRLVNSLTIKMEIVDIYIEDNVSKLYGKITSNDLNKHKYYMNLKGEKHFTNNDIVIYIQDIDREDVITLDNITKYSLLRNELLKYGDLFNSVMKKYPSDALYIRGILNPIYNPVDAVDGSILSYNKNLLKDSEYSVILEIETFIRKILKTNNIRYSVDNLYVPSLLGSIYNLLPLLIYFFRSKNMRTSEVSDFDLFSYLGSYKRLEESDMSFMNNEKTLLWLYNNLPYLKKEIGSNYTIDKVMKYIYEYNNVGIADVQIFNNVPNVIDGNILDSKKLFFENGYSLKNIKSNKAYKLNNLKTDIQEIMGLEYRLDYINEDDYSKIDNIDDKLKSIIRSSGTKDFIFDEIDIRIGYNTTILTLLFNNLIYYLKNDNLSFSKKIINPSNGLYITLNNKSIYYMTLSCFVLMQGGKLEDTFINGYAYSGIINPNITREMLIKNTILGDKLIPIVDKFIVLSSNIKTPTTSDDFDNNIKVIKEINSLVWFYISNSNDIVLASDLRLIIERLYLTETIEEDSSKSLKTLLADSLDIDEVAYIDSQKTFETLTIIYDKVFNIKVDEYYLIELQYKQYINFINKFKSYTIKFLYNTSFTNKIFSYFTSINIGSQTRTLIDVYDARFKRFTYVDTSLSSISLAFSDNNIYYSTLLNSIINVEVAEKTKLITISSNIIDNDILNYNFFNKLTLPTKLRTTLKEKNYIDVNDVVNEGYKYVVEIEEFSDTYLNSDNEKIIDSEDYSTVFRETLSKKMSTKIKQSTNLKDDTNLNSHTSQELTIDDANNLLLVEDLSKDVVEVNEINVTDTE